MEIWDKTDAVKKAIKSLTYVEFDEETTNQLTDEIVENLNILENANLKAFKNHIKGDPGKITEPASILVNTLSDREYLLCMHFANKIIDAMIEYAHRLVRATEMQYEERMSSEKPTRKEFAKMVKDAPSIDNRSAYDLNETGGFKRKNK